jgi:hypothetical protein
MQFDKSWFYIYKLHPTLRIFCVLTLVKGRQTFVVFGVLGLIHHEVFLHAIVAGHLHVLIRGSHHLVNKVSILLSFVFQQADTSLTY